MIVDNHILDKILDQTERIVTEKLDNISILIDTDDKLPNDITSKDDLILMTCVIKDGDKFYSQLFSKEALHNE